jgi:N-acetyl-anhydromuramyl-L-alanine amidase AmpD
MVLQKLVTIAVRPRRAWPNAVLLSVAALTVGCSHDRQSYRPIYSTRGAVSAPCTTCGSASTITTPESTIPPVTSGTPLSESATTDSSVPALPPPTGSGNGSSRGAAVESLPRAKIGGQPDEFDDLSPTTGRRGNASPNSTNKPNKSNQGPELQAPAPPQPVPPAASNTNSPDVQVAATTSKVVRRTGVSEQLRSFVDDASANELIYPNKADRPWRYIVLHHSAASEGNYDQIDREHRKVLGFDGCGYHFVIGNGTGSDDGQIEIAQRWINQKQGVHCRNARTHDVDEYGIGICLVGDFDQQPPTPRQIAAAKALVAYLSQRYNIAQSRVTTHVQLAATPTVCPGKYFPSESILPVTKGATRGPSARTAWRAVRDSSKTY